MSTIYQCDMKECEVQVEGERNLRGVSISKGDNMFADYYHLCPSCLSKLKELLKIKN